MTRTSPSKNRAIAAKKAAASGGNRTLALVLAGFTALVIVIIALLAIFSTAQSGNAQHFIPKDQGLIKVGQKLPNFSTKTIDGKNASLYDAGHKKATMLVMFASWCPHCQKEAPVIAGFSKKYPDLRVMMVGVAGSDNPNTSYDEKDNPQRVRDFVDRYGIQGQAAFAPAIAHRYGVSGYPTVYVLNDKHEVVGANSGEAPSSVYEGWIRKAL